MEIAAPHIGNPANVHPADKVDVGRSRALAARAHSRRDIARTRRSPVSPGHHRRLIPSREVRSRRALTAQGREVTSVEGAARDGKFYPAIAKG